LTKSALAKHGFAQADILSQWTAIAGVEIATLCAPERIKWPREGGTGTLILRAQAGRGLELQYQVPLIMERINRYFGYPAISAVKIVQSGAAKQNVAAPVKLDPTSFESRLTGFSDERLKSALAQLGAGVAQRSPQTK
jgi:hypothetical protein